MRAAFCGEGRGEGSHSRELAVSRQNMSSIKTPRIHQVIASQLILLVFIGAVTWLILGWTSAFSLVLGGLISALPNAWFTRHFFQHRGARATQQAMRAFYVGKAITLILTGAGFILAFVTIESLNVLALFSGFVLAHFAGLVLFARVAGQAGATDVNSRTQD
jgi:ATP synthase protein I